MIPVTALLLSVVVSWLSGRIDRPQRHVLAAVVTRDSVR
jgi:hypothetical protein